MKKLFVSLLVALLALGTATVAKAQHIVGPSVIDIYSWDILLPLPGYPEHASEFAKVRAQIDQYGYPTNETQIVTNRLKPLHIWQPQAVGNQVNWTLTRINRIVSRVGNTLVANNLTFLGQGSEIAGTLTTYTNLSDPNLVFNTNFIVGISRPVPGPILPRIGTTNHVSGRTLDQPVGEIIVAFPFKYLPYPLDSVVAFLHLDPPTDTGNYRLGGTTDYSTGGVRIAYSIKSLDSKAQPTNGLPKIVFSVSPTNSSVYHLKGLAEHDRSYILERSTSIVGTNWVTVGTGNNGDIWQVQNSPTNTQVFFRLRNQ